MFEQEALTVFSAAEEYMFNSLDLGHLLNQRRTALSIYRNAVEELFISGVRGPAVDAMRAAAKAIRDSTHYRLTTKFDKLIMSFFQTEFSDGWQVACGGMEPVMLCEGKHYQYCWNKESKEHAYYCFEDDRFFADNCETLPKMLSGK